MFVPAEHPHEEAGVLRSTVTRGLDELLRLMDANLDFALAAEEGAGIVQGGETSPSPLALGGTEFRLSQSAEASLPRDAGEAGWGWRRASVSSPLRAPSSR